jgi:hypothetical protein
MHPSLAHSFVSTNQTRFKNDLGRWRTLLQEPERVMFEEIVCAVWDIEFVPTIDFPDEPNALCRFQELAQNLISLEETNAFKSRSWGSRLRTVQRQLKKRKGKISTLPVLPDGSFHSISSVLGRLTHDTDEFHDEDLDLGEFIDLDALEGYVNEPKRVSSTESMDTTAAEWKDVHPRVVSILASVAFSIGLTALSGEFAGPWQLTRLTHIQPSKTVLKRTDHEWSLEQRLGTADVVPL